MIQQYPTCIQETILNHLTHTEIKNITNVHNDHAEELDSLYVALQSRQYDINPDDHQLIEPVISYIFDNKVRNVVNSSKIYLCEHRYILPVNFGYFLNKNSFILKRYDHIFLLQNNGWAIMNIFNRKRPSLITSNHNTDYWKDNMSAVLNHQETIFTDELSEYFTEHTINQQV